MLLGFHRAEGPTLLAWVQSDGITTFHWNNIREKLHSTIAWGGWGIAEWVTLGCLYKTKIWIVIAKGDIIYKHISHFIDYIITKQNIPMRVVYSMPMPYHFDSIVFLLCCCYTHFRVRRKPIQYWLMLRWRCCIELSWVALLCRAVLRLLRWLVAGYLFIVIHLLRTRFTAAKFNEIHKIVFIYSLHRFIGISADICMIMLYDVISFEAYSRCV